MTTYLIPVSPRRQVALTVSDAPMTPDEWATMLGVLRLFREGLVVDAVEVQIVDDGATR